MTSKKNEILKLYQLIDKYLANEVNEADFCEEFFNNYDMTINIDDLTDREKKVFDSINRMVGDYYEYEEKGFYSLTKESIKQSLKQKIKEAKDNLKGEDIYENNDKRRLYWLIDQYISRNIDETTFSDEFYITYGLGIDQNQLSEVEKKIFHDLDEVSGRFSPFEKDHQSAPKAFYTKEELKQKIIEAQQLLKIGKHKKRAK